MLTLPTQAYLKSLLDYDPASGRLTWKLTQRVAGGIRTRVGKTPTHRVKIDQVLYASSRVIWKMMTGVDSPVTVDHADLNPLNNAWANLRLADYSQQNCNQGERKPLYKLTPGKGVNRVAKRYRARIAIPGTPKQMHLGYFDTAQEAHDAYCAAAKSLHGAFHHP